MTNLELGKLTMVDPRKIWPTEPEFTLWLADHIELLSEALGLEIELIEAEVPVGGFSADLSGKVVGSGEEIVIENQLEPTDHSHLGQLLTYGAGREARTIVWVSTHFREEHKQALDWLNLHTDENLSFFGVELEVWIIGDSECAPHFNLVAQPSDWQKQVGAAGKRPLSPKKMAYHDFFSDLLGRLKAQSPGFTSSRRAPYDNWMSFGSGTGGFGLVAEFMRPHWFRVQVYIDTGDKARNKSAFDQLVEQREALESKVGESLVWLRLDDKNACRILAQREGSIDSPPEVLDGLKDWAVGQLPTFKQVFGPRLKALKLDRKPS